MFSKAWKAWKATAPLWNTFLNEMSASHSEELRVASDMPYTAYHNNECYIHTGHECPTGSSVSPGGWRQVWQNARRMCATGSWKALEWLCRLPKDEAKSDDLAIWSYIDRPMHVSEVFGIPPPLCLASSNFQESEHCVLTNDKLLMSELRVQFVCWAKNLTSFIKLQAQLC